MEELRRFRRTRRDRAPRLVRVTHDCVHVRVTGVLANHLEIYPAHQVLHRLSSRESGTIAQVGGRS